VDILSCLQTRPNFHKILSTTNDYSQTFAHLSILYGYPSLLRHLVEWCIDLAISDVNGLTALHCAFMKGDLDSVHILRQGGASETVTDKLGRTPSELGPGGFSSAIGRDGRVAAGTKMYMGEHALKASFTARVANIEAQILILKQDNTYSTSVVAPIWRLPVGILAEVFPYPSIFMSSPRCN